MDTNDTQTQEEEIEEVREEEKNPLQEKVDELENKYRRALADYQNLEKRVRDDRIELIQASNRELLLRLLPVLDTLLLAQAHIKDEGLKVSIQQFQDVLKSEGVTRIETENKDFDPMTMECIVTVPGKEGKVLGEVRAGYLMHDKLLRAAQVQVGNGEKEKN